MVSEVIIYVYIEYYKYIIIWYIYYLLGMLSIFLFKNLLIGFKEWDLLS